MFISKRKLRDLKAEIKEVKEFWYNHSHRDLVECQVCGCYLEKYGTAIKGRPEIRTREWSCPPRKEDYIYYPYYCKVCINAGAAKEPKK